MPVQHISKLSAADFTAVIGQTFQIPTGDGTRKWILLDVETHTTTLAGDGRVSTEKSKKLPAKRKMDAKKVAKLAKDAVDAINANLDEIGYTGRKVKGPINTITLGFSGVPDMEPVSEGEYSLFHEGIGTIECVHVVHTISKDNNVTPHYDVTFNV